MGVAKNKKTVNNGNADPDNKKSTTSKTAKKETKETAKRAKTNAKENKNSAKTTSKESGKKSALKETQNQQPSVKESKQKKAQTKQLKKTIEVASKEEIGSKPTSKRPSAMENKDAQRGKKRGRPTAAETTEQKRPKLTEVVHPTHLSSGGVVLALGEGDTGQLGLGPDVMERTKPGKVTLPEQVIQICAGGMHTVCVTAKGQVYTWGCNDEGALGRKTADEDDCMEPGVVELPETVVQVSAGDSHTAALTKYGHVYAWGTFRDANGSIGLTTSGKTEVPVEMMGSDTVACRIVSGADHLACLTTDGELYTVGNGEQGQLGRVAECFSNRGGRKGLGLLLTPGRVHVKKRSTKFDNVWAGSYVTYAHTTDGKVYTWGLNNYYQLGFSDIKNRYVPECAKSFSDKLDWKELAGGQHHTIALDGKGKHHTIALDGKGVVYTLGRKEYGRLGLGEDVGEEKARPTEVKALQGHKCINVACGTAVSFAVTEKGEVYAWGMGTSKQLGQTEEDDLWEPTQMTGKQLENRKCVQVTSGGQHTVVLACEK